MQGLTTVILANAWICQEGGKKVGLVVSGLLGVGGRGEVEEIGKVEEDAPYENERCRRNW